MALQYFGGHPETSFHVLAAAFLFALLRGPRRVVWFLGGVAAGTALAAVVLIPFVELLAHSSDLANRSGRDPARTPLRFGLALALPDYWGRPTQLVSRAVHRHAGVLRGRAAADARGGGAAAADARAGRDRGGGRGRAAVVLGVQPFFFVANHVPGFSQAHNTRLAIVTLLCIALLAGWGLDSLRAVAGADRDRRLRRASRRCSRGWRGPARTRSATRCKVAWGFVTPNDIGRPAAGLDPDLDPVRGARGGADL